MFQKVVLAADFATLFSFTSDDFYIAQILEITSATDFSCIYYCIYDIQFSMIHENKVLTLLLFL